MIRNVKLLEKLFLISYKFIEVLPRVIGSCKYKLLYLVKLVNTKYALSIFTVRAGFSPKARTNAYILKRQSFFEKTSPACIAAIACSEVEIRKYASLMCSMSFSKRLHCFHLLRKGRLRSLKGLVTPL